MADFGSYSTSRPHRRGTSLDGGDMGDANRSIRNAQHIGRRTQDLERKARLVAALRQERLAAIKSGKMVSSLPEIHDRMSEADIEKAANTINRVMGRPKDYDFSGDDSKKPGQATAKPQNQGPVRNPNAGKPASTEPLPLAPKDILKQRKDGAITADQARQKTSDYYQAKRDRQPAPRLAPAGSPERKPKPSGNPMLDQMVRDGTLPQGAKLSKTGAGYSTEAMSESGPRQVAIQPTGLQALVGKFGDAYANATPEGRAAILRANPAQSEQGQVIDSGATAFDHTGQRVVQTTGGPVVEVDPSRDARMTFLDPSKPLAGAQGLMPQGAMRGMIVPEQYRPTTPAAPGEVVGSGAAPANPLVAYSTPGAPAAAPAPAPAPVPAPAPAPQIPVAPSVLAQGGKPPAASAPQPSTAQSATPQQAAQSAAAPVAPPVPVPAAPPPTGAATITQVVQPTIPTKAPTNASLLSMNGSASAPAGQAKPKAPAQVDGADDEPEGGVFGKNGVLHRGMSRLGMVNYPAKDAQGGEIAPLWKGGPQNGGSAPVTDPMAGRGGVGFAAVRSNQTRQPEQAAANTTNAEQPSAALADQTARRKARNPLSGIESWIGM